MIREDRDPDQVRGGVEDDRTPETLQLLLVEDSAYDIWLIRRMLGQIGPVTFEVQCVDSVADAMRHLDHDTFDVVLLDLGLRDSSGLATLERLHRHRQDVPIVVLTGRSEADLGLRAVQLGAEDYLVKGQVGAASLGRALRYVVERYRRHQLQGALRSLQQKLAVAREIQTQLLACPPADPRVDVWGAVYPATHLSGDFHDIIPLPDGRLGLALGDVTGHGFGSALLMATARAYVRAILHWAKDVPLGQVFQQVNALLADDVGAERFVCLSVAVLDPGSGEVTFISAGQPAAYVVPASGPPRALHTPANLPLGVERTSTYYGVMVQLQAGDMLALTTDGALEAESHQGEQFEVNNLLKVLGAHRSRSAREVVQSVYEAVEAHSGPLCRRDDVSVLVARLT